MKKIILKVIIIVFVFLAALLTISKIMNKGNTDLTVEMAKASLPVVSIQYAGREVNELHGYTQDMEINYMRDGITPLAAGRRTSLTIDCYGQIINGISFEVRSVDGTRLIEDTEIEEFEQKDDQIQISFTLKDLIETNKEYVLILFLEKEDGNTVRYYTRVVWAEDYHTAEKLDYIVDFNNKTFDKEKAKELTKYLESNSEGDNTTFGKVNIHSSFHQVTWGDLTVEKETGLKIQINELAAQTGSFTLKYFVSIEEDGEKAYHRVEEFYRIRYTADRIYLLDFERTMNRVFDEKAQVYSGDKLYLGIMGDDVPLAESEGGNVVAFVVGDRLFSYNIVDNKQAYLFGFYDEDNSDDRTLYDKHDIQILNVDEAGNVTFMVYGYMNRGRHEGQTGISVYYYDSTVNTTEEMVYVSYYKSPDLLMAEIKQLSYVNKTGILYLMLDNVIYGISSMSRSYEVVATDLAEGSYQVSDSNLMVVWQKDSQDYGSKELVLMNLNTGEQTEIKARGGELLSPIGFMEEDLIYGVAREGDIVRDETGNIIFPMYCVKIQNETEGVLKEYRQQDVYITGGDVSENQIILKRVQKDEEGNYEEILDDHIMNAEIEDGMENTVERVAIDVYEKITRIALKDAAEEASIKYLTPKEVLFEGGRNITIRSPQTEYERFYVYGQNGVEGIFMKPGNAVNLAYEKAGVVVNEAGEYVWLKGNRSTKNQIMAITGQQMTEEKTSLAVCLDTILTFEGISRNIQYMLDQGYTVFEILVDNLDEYQILDLTDCSLDAVLYYVNQDIPVLVMMEDGSAVLLIGFNEQNTVLMNPETGTVYKMGMNDSKEWFEQNGNKFITYIRNKNSK
ncbi:MAG: hypothetical protein J6J79_02345 [Lachnospiraceae bacterium]|nr:hypothetical protein [Lachnospiraceae bacterium]